LKNKLLFLVYKVFGQSSLFNKLVRFIYLSLLIPTLNKSIKFFIKEISFIESRHSVLDPIRFSAVLSDLDIYVVLKDERSIKKVTKIFILINRFLPMIDKPEVYTEEEFRVLNKIRSFDDWNIVQTFWQMRKISWNNQSLAQDFSEINQIKKKRSNKISIDKILKKEKYNFDFHTLNDFVYLDKFFNDKTNEKNICLYVAFLETNKKEGLEIRVDFIEFEKIISILPGEKGEFSELKLNIIKYEILITKASRRLDEAQNLNCDQKIIWQKSLESSIGSLR
jgi:hypothetical protein